MQEALQFLNQVRLNGVPLLLDTGGHIFAEYDRNFTNRRLGKGFVFSQMKRGEFTMHDGKPNASCAQALALLGFDPSDIPYVGVAQSGGGLYLTHETKHLTSERIEAIEQHCGVRVVDLAQARAALDLK